MTDEQQPQEEQTFQEELASHDEQPPQEEGLMLDALSPRIHELEEQLAHAQEQVLRAAAEVQNIRRRAEMDVEKAHKFALEKFTGDLLTVVDTLERGLHMSDPQDEVIKPMRDGLELTLKMLIDTLHRYQVEVIDPLGEPFNPDQHQAMTMQESDTAEPNTVLQVFQKGYSINGRLLRPAMVVVSKAS